MQGGRPIVVSDDTFFIFPFLVRSPSKLKTCKFCAIKIYIGIVSVFFSQVVDVTPKERVIISGHHQQPDMRHINFSTSHHSD